jgi:hypothetical protein
VPDKFAGLGLKNVLLLWMIFIVLTVMAKVIFVKYPVPGVSDVVGAV